MGSTNIWLYNYVQMKHKTNCFNLLFNVNAMLCFNKNVTDSLSVAPVRYPVVQISSKLHIMKQKKKNKRAITETEQEKKI